MPANQENCSGDSQQIKAEDVCKLYTYNYCNPVPACYVHLHAKIDLSSAVVPCMLGTGEAVATGPVCPVFTGPLSGAPKIL